MEGSVTNSYGSVSRRPKGTGTQDYSEYNQAISSGQTGYGFTPRDKYLLRLAVWADSVSLHGEGDLAPDASHLLLGEGGEGPHLTRHHSPRPCVLSCHHSYSYYQCRNDLVRIRILLIRSFRIGSIIV
jgi:hypothetical protein